MQIALIGKYNLILNLLDSYLIDFDDTIEVSSYPENQLSAIRKKFDYVILNSLGYIGDITKLMEQASLLTSNIQNLILISTNQVHSRISGYQEFSACGTAKELLALLNIDTKNTTSTEDNHYRVRDLYRMLSHSHEAVMLLHDLTRQEKRILCQLLSNRDYPSICDKFNIRESTLKKHNNHIFKKMNVRTRNELQLLVERDINFKQK